MGKLTKTQQAELDGLRSDLETARALSWPNFPKPLPIQRPTESDKLIHGWSVNTYTLRIEEYWQDSLYQYHNARQEGGSRGRDNLYASPREAWLALYHELCEKYGKELARVLRNAEKGDT